MVLSSNIIVDDIFLVDEIMAPGNTSDHSPVLFKLRIPTKIKKLKTNKTEKSRK